MKKSKIIIHTATKKDLKEIERLVNYLMRVEKSDNPERMTDLIIKERVAPTFKKSSLNKTFLAEADNKIIGLIILEVKYKLVLSIAYIVIDKNYQKLGIGSVLINHAQKYAKRIGRKNLQVLVHKNNKKAQQFYKKQKFSLFCYLLQKEIK